MWLPPSRRGLEADPFRLSSRLMEEVARVERRLETMADSIVHGDRLSSLPGRGLEVAGVREYREGDEARGIDWRVTARTGRLHVKEFEEERHLSSLVVVDRSPILAGGRGGIRLIRCLEIAGLLSALALKEGDRAGLFQSGSQARSYIPPARGPNQLSRIVGELLRGEGEVAGSAPREEPLPGLLEKARRLLRGRSRIFLVGGFHIPAVERPDTRKELARLRQRHALIPVRVLDAQEGAWTGRFPVPLKDLRFGILPASPAPKGGTGGSAPVGQALRDALNREEEEVGELLSGVGLEEWRVDVSDSLMATIRSCIVRGRWSGGSRV